MTQRIKPGTPVDLVWKVLCSRDVSIRRLRTDHMDDAADVVRTLTRYGFTPSQIRRDLDWPVDVLHGAIKTVSLKEVVRDRIPSITLEVTEPFA